jgi:predicted phage tail protein
VGLFQHKQHSDKKSRSPIVEVYEDEKNFFDESFREEIQNHARAYFETVIKENVVVFKQDLDAAVAAISEDLKTHTIGELDGTIAKVNAELKEHALRQLDEKFAAYGKEMKDAQDATLANLNKSAETLEGQYQALTTTIQKSIANQGVMINGVFEENMNRMTAMKDEQAVAIQTIKDSAVALQTQAAQLGETLKKNVEEQENVVLTAFQDNMAQIVEHYLLGALGDQYDLKAQLPSIIKQMDANKDVIIGDMKL